LFAGNEKEVFWNMRLSRSRCTSTIKRVGFPWLFLLKTLRINLSLSLKLHEQYREKGIGSFLST